MTEEHWNELLEEARQGDDGPWLCYDCDEAYIELSQRFENGEVVEIALSCMACDTLVTGPA